LLAGELRYCLRSASSAEASLHPALATRCGIFVRSRFPMAGRSVRAVDSRFPMPQFFAVAASALNVRDGTLERLLSDSPSLAIDPLRSSAGGAEPDRVTSDALCRAAALTQKAPLPSRSPHAPAFRRARLEPPRQNEQCRCLFKATDHTPSRTPFISVMLSLATKPGWVWATCYSRSRNHPSTLLSAAEKLSFAEEEPTTPPYPPLS
jgi:hypothetical protein